MPAFDEARRGGLYTRVRYSKRQVLFYTGTQGELEGGIERWMQWWTCWRQTHTATLARGSGVRNAGILLNHSYVRDVWRVDDEGEGGTVTPGGGNTGMESGRFSAKEEIKKGNLQRGLNEPIYSFVTYMWSRTRPDLRGGRVRRAFRGGEDLWRQPTKLEGLRIVGRATLGATSRERYRLRGRMMSRGRKVHAGGGLGLGSSPQITLTLRTTRGARFRGCSVCHPYTMTCLSLRTVTNGHGPV
jgi:hypothetical protein